MTAPATDLPILDLDHLRRQTFGDVALERELLALFIEQCGKLFPLLSGDDLRGDRAVAAHTLKGSARAIGAWRLASLAEPLEAALMDQGPEAAGLLMRDFGAAIEATRQAVAERCRSGSAESPPPPLAIPPGLP
jgi:HPt (histidine-containing phosphotransfer) domain-containing protein